MRSNRQTDGPSMGLATGLTKPPSASSAKKTPKSAQVILRSRRISSLKSDGPSTPANIPEGEGPEGARIRKFLQRAADSTKAARAAAEDTAKFVRTAAHCVGGDPYCSITQLNLHNGYQNPNASLDTYEEQKKSACGTRTDSTWNPSSTVTSSRSFPSRGRVF